MAALSPIVTTGLPVFTGVTGFLNTQRRLDQQEERAASDQRLAEQRLQLQRDRLAADTTSSSASGDGQSAAERQQAVADRLRATQDLQRRQLLDRQAADTAAEDARIQTQMDQVQLAANDDERNRRTTLRQDVAKSTVSLAGQGVDPTDGSGAAIRLGKIESSDEQRRSADTATRLRLQALSQQADALNRRNLLEAQQLADRQRLQWLNTFGG